VVTYTAAGRLAYAASPLAAWVVMKTESVAYPVADWKMHWVAGIHDLLGGSLGGASPLAAWVVMKTESVAYPVADWKMHWVAVVHDLLGGSLAGERTWVMQALALQVPTYREVTLATCLE